MVMTSQLATFPSNALVAGTTPVQQIMVANLAPGGRITSYDPQRLRHLSAEPAGNTRPQHPGGSAFGLGLRVDRQRQLRGDDAYARAGRPQHRRSSPRGRWTASTSRRSSPCPSTSWCRWRPFPGRSPEVQQVSEGFLHDPLLQRGFGADFQDTRYPFYPGPRPSLQAGQSESWFFGESLEAGVGHGCCSPSRRRSTRHVRFGLLGTDGITHWTAAQERAARADTVGVRLPLAEHASGSSSRPSVRLPPHQAVITAGGSPYELGGALSSAVVPDRGGRWGRRRASRSSRRGVLRIRSSRSPQEVVESRYGCSRARPSPRWCGSTRRRPPR